MPSKVDERERKPAAMLAELAPRVLGHYLFAARVRPPMLVETKLRGSDGLGFPLSQRADLIACDSHTPLARLLSLLLSDLRSQNLHTIQGIGDRLSLFGCSAVIH